MKIKTSVLFTLFVFAFTVSAFGQTKVVTKAEFDELEKYKENTGKLSRIETVVTTEYNNKIIVKIIKNVREFESEDRYKYTTFFTGDGTTEKINEYIKYDERTYRRDKEGEWEEITGRPRGTFILGDADIEPIYQYTITDSEFKQKPIRIFSNYTILKIGERLNFNEYLDYVDKEGKLVYEKIIRSRFHPENITMVTEISYDYDTKDLKIEIPKTAKIVN